GPPHENRQDLGNLVSHARRTASARRYHRSPLRKRCPPDLPTVLFHLPWPELSETRARPENCRVHFEGHLQRTCDREGIARAKRVVAKSPRARHAASRLRPDSS